MKATVQITVETESPETLAAVLQACKGISVNETEVAKPKGRGRGRAKPAVPPAASPMIPPAPGAGTTGVGAPPAPSTGATGAGVPPAPGAAAPGVTVPGTAAPAAITIDTLKEAVRAKVDAEGIAPVKVIISAYGATKLSDVKESDYPALLADLQGLTD